MNAPHISVQYLNIIKEIFLQGQCRQKNKSPSFPRFPAIFVFPCTLQIYYSQIVFCIFCPFPHPISLNPRRLRIFAQPRLQRVRASAKLRQFLERYSVGRYVPFPPFPRPLYLFPRPLRLFSTRGYKGFARPLICVSVGKFSVGFARRSEPVTHAVVCATG